MTSTFEDKVNELGAGLKTTRQDIERLLEKDTLLQERVHSRVRTEQEINWRQELERVIKDLQHEYEVQWSRSSRHSLESHRGISAEGQAIGLNKALTKLHELRTKVRWEENKNNNNSQTETKT